MCTGAFAEGKLPQGINHTLIYLIPKNPNAASLKDFRPISLCNTTYKVITKIIARKLRQTIVTLIGLYQSSCLKHRRTSDNAIIVQKVVSYLTKKRKGKSPICNLRLI